MKVAELHFSRSVPFLELNTGTPLVYVNEMKNIDGFTYEAENISQDCVLIM